MQEPYHYAEEGCSDHRNARSARDLCLCDGRKTGTPCVEMAVLVDDAESHAGGEHLGGDAFFIADTVDALNGALNYCIGKKAGDEFFVAVECHKTL